MQRAVTAGIALVIIFAMGLNLLLFMQNQDLRRRIATTPPPTPALDQTAKLDDLSAELERYKKDFNKAVGEARTLREQNTTLSSAAQQRDTLQNEVDTLRQENQQLKNEVENLQTMNTVNGQVSALRGLPARSTVPRSFMNQAELRSYFSASFEREYSPADETRDQTVLRALDMGGGESTGREAQIDSLASSVLGFYDQESKQLVVVTNRPQMGVGDQITYAHEFTHSLQDQHYDLTNLFKRGEGNADYQMAIRALVEGDATTTMSLYAQQHLDQMDMVNYQLEMIRNLDPYSALYGGGGGGPMVESSAYFPYQEGAVFAQALYMIGGYAEVDLAYANPPRSTEQVIHPEKYLEGDEPVPVALPNLAATLDGWQLVQENTLGELYLRIYLEHALAFDRAIPAGEGWGGDRYQVLQDGQGRLALALSTAWDTPADAQEFFEAYATFVPLLGGGNATPLASSDAELRWQLPGRQFLLRRSGMQVLVIHAPDAVTLDRLAAQL